jgi:hypothetical protein
VASPGLYSSGVAASMMGDGSMGRLLVTGNGMRGKRDERRWCGLHPLLGVAI